MRLNVPERFAPFADGVFPTPSGKCEFYSERMKADGLDPLPTYIPPHEDPQTRPELAARYPLAALQPAPAPVSQLDVRQFATPSDRGRRSDDRALGRRRADARLERRPVGRGVQRPRPVSSTGCAYRERTPRRGRRTGIYWNKLSPGSANVNSTTSSALTDMGGGATFFDNLVEVRASTLRRRIGERSRVHTMTASEVEPAHDEA